VLLTTSALFPRLGLHRHGVVFARAGCRLVRRAAGAPGLRGAGLRQTAYRVGPGRSATPSQGRTSVHGRTRTAA